MTATPRTRLVIPADAVVNLNHAASATARIPVADTGATALRVTASVGDYTKHAQQYPGASWVTSISPAALVIQPGQTGYFTLHIRVPAGAEGDHYANFLARAAPAGSHGGASLSLAVGGTLRLEHPGHVAPLTPHHLVPVYRPPASSSHAVWLIVVAVAVLAVAGLAAAGARRWKRHRDALADTEMRGQYPSYNHARNPARHRTP